MSEHACPHCGGDITDTVKGAVRDGCARGGRSGTGDAKRRDPEHVARASALGVLKRKALRYADGWGAANGGAKAVHGNCRRLADMMSVTSEAKHAIKIGADKDAVYSMLLKTFYYYKGNIHAATKVPA